MNTLAEQLPNIQASRTVMGHLDKAIAMKKKIISCQGSARSAKTYTILIKLISECLDKPKTRLSIVRKTLPALKGSAFIDFRDIMIQMKQWDSKCFNKSEMIYNFPNGSWVEFFSTDDEQKIRGRKRKILFCNEANEISENEWTQLKIRTTGLIILDYNPSFSEDHWIEGVNKEEGTYHFISTYKDNPFLEQTVIDAIESLKDKNRSLWTIYGLGLRAAVEGRIFTDYEIVDEIPPWVHRQFIGLDFGYTFDPTAGINVGLYGTDLYIDELFYKTHMLTGDIIRALKPFTFGNKKVISESADPRLVDEIYNAGINIYSVIKYQGSVEAGIGAMQGLSIKITKKSYNAKKELDNYVYAQDKNGKWLNTPVDAYNHIMDAARYVILTEVLGVRQQRGRLKDVLGMLPGV